MIRVICKVDKELFYSEESSMGVYGCSLVETLEGNLKLNSWGNFTLSGSMPKLDKHKEYTIIVKEAIHKKYGLQYHFINMEIERNPSKKEQYKFLSTLLTDNQLIEIKKIYDKPVTAIINKEFDYSNIKGVGRKTYEKIEKKVLENYVLFDLLAELGEYGITYNQIKKMYDKYLDSKKAIEQINENPYILMELDGIGFKKADAIAMKMGIDKNDKRRIVASIEYVLEEEEKNGHVWTYVNTIKSKVEELCDGLEEDIFYYIGDTDRYWVKGDRACLVKTRNAEFSIANDIKRLLRNNSPISENNYIKKYIEKQENNQGYTYSEKQKEFFYHSISESIAILTGYAGTGKTTVVNGLLNMFDELGLSYKLMSPSAKAAKVVEKYTGRTATTIHRGLGWTHSGFIYNGENKLQEDIILVDEFSMVGVWIFARLIEAVKNGAKLILIGDAGQLESIEVGNLLDDMIKSGKIKTTQLTEVFRQAQDSGIIQLATKVRNGEKFLGYEEYGVKTFGTQKDAVLILDNKENTRNNIIRTYKSLLQKYNSDDIVVLFPIRKGEVGTQEFNELLQEINNPPDGFKQEVAYGKKIKKIFRENDRCIHTANMYDEVWLDEKFEEMSGMGVYNGDTGNIVKIIKGKDGNMNVYVDFGDKIIEYNYFDVLDHAWALTTHKFQGSQSKVVIMGLDSRHYFVSKRSLLYTGITRASELLVLCGDSKTINKAIETNNVIEKRTFLKEFLVDL